MCCGVLTFGGSSLVGCYLHYKRRRDAPAALAGDVQFEREWLLPHARFQDQLPCVGAHGLRARSWVEGRLRTYNPPSIRAGKVI